MIGTSNLLEDKLELQLSLDMSHVPWIAVMNMTEQFRMVRPGPRLFQIRKIYARDSSSDVTNELWY